MFNFHKCSNLNKSVKNATFFLLILLFTVNMSAVGIWEKRNGAKRGDRLFQSELKIILLFTRFSSHLFTLSYSLLYSSFTLLFSFSPSFTFPSFSFLFLLLYATSFAARWVLPSNSYLHRTVAPVINKKKGRIIGAWYCECLTGRIIRSD